MKLENSVAIITGAASGIGRAAAELFAAEGARLALADIDAKGSQRALHSRQRRRHVASGRREPRFRR